MHCRQDDGKSRFRGRLGEAPWSRPDGRRDEQFAIVFPVLAALGPDTARLLEAALDGVPGFEFPSPSGSGAGGEGSEAQLDIAAEQGPRGRGAIAAGPGGEGLAALPQFARRASPQLRDPLVPALGRRSASHLPALRRGKRRGERCGERCGEGRRWRARSCCCWAISPLLRFVMSGGGHSPSGFWRFFRAIPIRSCTPRPVGSCESGTMATGFQQRSSNWKKMSPSGGPTAFTKSEIGTSTTRARPTWSSTPSAVSMGSPESEHGPDVKIEQQHSPEIGRRYAIAATPVTVEQFHRFLTESTRCTVCGYSA